ncbi:hypothetical protein P7C71_g3220, partial [Lecanoromycetidae sp. Uapishka_2]
MNPWFKRCTGGVFTGFDPPQTLVPAAVMAPVTTSSNPLASPSPIVLDDTQDPVAHNMFDSSVSAPAPASTPKVDAPKETAAAASDHKSPELVPLAGDPATPTTSSVQPADTSQDPIVDMDQQNNEQGEPSQNTPALPEATAPWSTENVNEENNPNPSDNSIQTQAGLPQSKNMVQAGDSVSTFDPANTSPEQMSQIEDALSPTTFAQNPPEQQKAPQVASPSPNGSDQTNQNPPESPVQGATQQQNDSPLAQSNSKQMENGSSGTFSAKSPSKENNIQGQDTSPKVSQSPNVDSSESSEHSGPQQQSNTPSNPDDSQRPSDSSGSPVPSVLHQQDSTPEQISSPYTPAPSSNGSPEGFEQSDTGQQVDPSKNNPTPGIPGSPSNNVQAPAATTLSVASHAIVVGPSAVQIDGSSIAAQGTPMSVPGGAAINHGNSVVLGSQIYHIPSATPTPATTIAGHAITPIANGVIFNGDTITAGASAVSVSGFPISVGLSGQINIDSTPYQLPSANPSPTTTLPNGAAAVILSHAISIHGTTLSAGASAATISGTVVSLDMSNNLIYGATAVTLPSVALLPSTFGVTMINGTSAPMDTAGGVASQSSTGVAGIIVDGFGSAGGSTATTLASGSVPTQGGNGSTMTTTTAPRPKAPALPVHERYLSGKEAVEIIRAQRMKWKQLTLGVNYNPDFRKGL